MDMLQAQIAQLQMQREAAERAAASQGQRSLEDSPAAPPAPGLFLTHASSLQKTYVLRSMSRANNMLSRNN